MRIGRRCGTFMVKGYAMLGETPELFKETEEWTRQEMKKIEKNENAKKQIMQSIQPLLDKKRKKLIMGQE